MRKLVLFFIFVMAPISIMVGGAFVPVFAKQKTPQNVDASYLLEMPEVNQVHQDIQGKDEFDTLARQSGVFRILVEALKERSQGRAYGGRLASSESKKLNEYQAEVARLQAEFQAKFAKPCLPEKLDDPECTWNMFGHYGSSKKYQKEIFARYFSPQWQEGYRQDAAAMEQRVRSSQAAMEARNQEQAHAQGRARGQGRDELGASLEGILAIGGVCLFILWLIWRIATSGRRKRKRNAAALAEVKRPDAEAWKQLGGTAEVREQNIRKLFDEKVGTLSYGGRWDGKTEKSFPDGEKGEVDAYIQFRISRGLAAMDPRDREFLRTAYLLFNANLISGPAFEYYRFAFISGNGKASIDSWTYSNELREKGVANGLTAVRFYQDLIDASVDSAVNALLGVLEKLGQAGNVSAVVKEIQGRLHGGGAWLAPEEVPSTLFCSNGAYAVRLGLLEGSQTPLAYGGEGSLITIAPPGSGKTQCFVLPTMLSWSGPAVVLDVKGEIYAATSKWRAQNIGPVFKFSPLDPANSHSYNPLTFIRQDPEYLWEDARFLADMMIVPSGASDPFWESMARDVLTSAIAYLCYHNPPDQRPIAKIMELIYGMGWDEMVLSLRTNLAVSAMRQMGHSLTEMEKKTRDSVLKTAQSSLSAWQGERINRVTKKSDWNPLDLRTGKPTIYICINPNEIDSYLSILRVFIAQHIRMLTSQLPPRDVAPVLFVLDELPRLKKMPPVDEALNIGRQYGIRLWMFAQSYGQLKEAYTNPEGILGSCVVRTFMNVPLNDELAQKLSDQLGYREGPLDASRTKLVEPLELAGPNYRDTVLVLATNTKPAKVRKAFAYQDPALTAKMGSI
ncbi:MAG: type IV secretory system conjugative DNA transfer family protein [Nitrospira sp.]